jgi:hypothetical protein
MSLGSHESSLSALLDVATRTSNQLHDRQTLARALIQLEAEQELLKRNQLLFAARRSLQHRQILNESFSLPRISGIQLEELVRLHEARRLQQLSHYESNRPIALNIPTTSFVQPPFSRSVAASQPADIFDLTVDDEDDTDNLVEKSGDVREHQDKGLCITSPNENEVVLSKTTSRKRKIDKVGTLSKVMRRDEVSKPYDATIGARGRAPKSPPRIVDQLLLIAFLRDALHQRILPCSYRHCWNR